MLNNSNESSDSGSGESDKCEYFLEEFGKLNLDYFPDKLGVFTGLNGTTFVLMSVDKDLVVFVIHTVLKKIKRSGSYLGRSKDSAMPNS